MCIHYTYVHMFILSLECKTFPTTCTRFTHYTHTVHSFNAHDLYITHKPHHTRCKLDITCKKKGFISVVLGQNRLLMKICKTKKSIVFIGFIKPINMYCKYMFC